VLASCTGVHVDYSADHTVIEKPEESHVLFVAKDCSKVGQRPLCNIY
jgi:hypothetical protein